MRQCPVCGEALGEGFVESCPSCDARIDGATEAFSAVDGEQGAAGVAAEGTHEPGAPALVVRNGPEVGERFFVDRERLTIGRDPSSDIFLNDVTVSRSHAVLVATPDEVSIEDAGSLNGTYVNDLRVDEAHLRDGDAVQIGTFQMIFMSGVRT